MQMPPIANYTIPHTSLIRLIAMQVLDLYRPAVYMQYAELCAQWHFL